MLPEQTLKDLQALHEYELIKQHPELLVKKIAEFPVKVATIAASLKFILETKEAMEQHGVKVNTVKEGDFLPLSVDQVITKMTKDIKQVFKDTFGYDLDAPYKVQSWVS